MISLKVVSTAAAMALLLPVVTPVASFAQDRSAKVGNGGGNRMGGMRAGNPGGAGFGNRGGGAPTAQFNAGNRGPVGVNRGGGYAGGYNRGYRNGGGGGFIPGAVAGAVIGGALASQAYYGPGYYTPGYYDDGYDENVVAVAPAPVGDDSVAYCMQTYRSYDPQSGTYLGFDGYRHACP